MRTQQYSQVEAIVAKYNVYNLESSLSPASTSFALGRT